MYDEFTATERWTGDPVHCIYQALIVAIATRHADAVDIKFLANGQPVWISLPHPAWVEYNKRSGRVITDPMAVQIAGRHLKTAIETGENGGREMHMLSVGQTLAHIDELEREFAGAARQTP